tara:strand:- start:496 stop:894 length:399 start_codon:yes stop_codon:yes gene_type:complete
MGQESQKAGFVLPGGEAEAGQIAFVSLNCVQCHTVAGLDFEEPKGKRRLDLELAAEVRFVKRYEDLIVAIMNPQHVVTSQYKSVLSKAQRDGEIKSFMPDLTNDMSARQLMDLVSFLDQIYSAQLDGYQSSK